MPIEEQPYKVPCNWVWVRLGSVTKFIDYRGKTPNKTESGIPLITAKNVKMNKLNEEPREFIAPEEYDSWMTRGIPNVGDILFTTEAPLGNVAQLNFIGKVALAQRIITIQPMLGNSTYLKFALMSPQMQGEIQQKSTGTTVQGIKASKLKLQPIPFPPLNEQKRIADKVERLLDKINQAKKLIEEAKETFELRRAAIMNKAFSGELTRKWREQNEHSDSIETLLQKINALKNEKKSNPISKKIISEPYTLPNGWKWIRLEELIEISSYGTSAKTNDDVGVPVLRMGNIYDGQLLLDNLKYLPTDHADVEKYKLEEYDLLFNRTNSYELVGKTAVVRGKQVTTMTYASYLVNVRLFFKEKIARYICYYINSNIGRNYLLSMVTQQVGQANINASKLASLIVPMPPEEEIAEITRLLGNYFDNEILIHQKLKLDNQLNSLEKAILAKAYNSDLGTNDEIEASPIALIKELLSNNH